MTEDEAKTKWCPFVRMSAIAVMGNEVSPAFNASTDAHGLERRVSCIASACMAWGWARAPRHASYPIGAAAVSAREGEGFCGLAGTPQ